MIFYKIDELNPHIRFLLPYRKCVGKLSTVTKVNDVHATANRAVKPPSKPRTAELFL